MKKHILSRFGTRTNHVTNSLSGPTVLTETIEVTDTDEFKLDKLVDTKMSEAGSVAGEFYLSGPTNLTFTQEETDADEIIKFEISNNNILDFDEVLCI